MREVEAVKTGEQRQQVEAHLAAQGAIYADIWKVGVNTALRISDLLSLTMDNVRDLNTGEFGGCLVVSIGCGEPGSTRATETD